MVRIGSARIDERGKAGDQTGSEVSTQNWYLHELSYGQRQKLKKSEKVKILFDRYGVEL